MGNNDLYGSNGTDYSQDPLDNSPHSAPEEHNNTPLPDILQAIFRQSEYGYPTEHTEEPSDSSAGDANAAAPEQADQLPGNFPEITAALDNESDYSELDTFRDSGAYRTYDGSREYRSFDASLPDASPDEWYHYSEEDRELDEDDPPTHPEPQDEEPKHRHRGLSILGHALLVFFTAFSIVYLVALYSTNPIITKMRTMYIQTAMSTLNHKWMATAIIPGDIIDGVMRLQYETDAAMVGIQSNWGTVNVQELPSFDAETISAADSPEEELPAEVSTLEEVHETDASPYETTDEETFFSLFWEIDHDSMMDYLDSHPEALDNGWAGIDINESGLEDSGTEITTIYGDQVLAVNAVDGVMLARVSISGSRGVMAICKDTSRLSLCAADTLGVIGQTAGKICDANDGVLAITASGFIDPEGVGNGGEISGLAICSGEIYGNRLGGSSKRLELRDDNKMYIVDSVSEIGEGTRDASEFQPAMIVDGEIISSDWNAPQPRAVLGQSSRLETMMVVVEGRYLDSPGCGVEDIAKVLLKYGCVQAINLDGGTSAIMYYDGEYVTRCSNPDLPSGRTLPTAWVYRGA